nr:uncharacterized protein LOC109188700 [Ipomoea trifida]
MSYYSCEEGCGECGSLVLENEEIRVGARIEKKDVGSEKGDEEFNVQICLGEDKKSGDGREKDFIEHILREYWVASSIIDVESVVDWYYISCKSNSCKRKVSDRGELIGVSAGDLKAKYLEKDQVESYYSACLGFAGMRKCLHIQHSASLLSVDPVRDYFGDNGVFVDVEADSGDFCSSGDEECVEDKSFSQGLDVQSCVGLEDVEEGLCVDCGSLPLKRNLLKDFVRASSSKKAKELMVKVEKQWIGGFVMVDRFFTVMCVV